MRRNWELWFTALCFCFLLSAGDLQKANEYLHQALQANDTNQRIELLRKSLQEQESFEGHYNLGKAYRDVHRFAEALQEFRSALVLTNSAQKVDRAHVFFQIGATLAQQGKGSEALAYLRGSIELEKDPRVEKAALGLQIQLASTVQKAPELEKALVAASRDLVLDDTSENTSAPKVPVWIQFEFDKADLASQGIAQAQELGRAITSNELAVYRFRLVGHTDLFGTREYNLALSRRRAETVARYLITQFRMAPDRIMPEGRGMDEPLVTTGSLQEQAVNRRVEVILVPAAQ